MKALLRIAVVWNIPVACNRASADFMISSPLMASEYTRLVPDYDALRPPPTASSFQAGASARTASRMTPSRWASGSDEENCRKAVSTPASR